MSFLQRDTLHTPYTSPFCRSTTYCNQDVHIGVEVGEKGGLRAPWPWETSSCGWLAHMLSVEGCGI